MSSAVFRVFLLLAVFVGIAEMCGNVQQAETTTISPSSTSDPNGRRKRRSVEGSSIAQVEFQTTLTSAGEEEFSKIESEISEEFEELLDRAHRQVANGVDGGSVLKYMFTEVDCGVVQLFAKAAKDFTSFITEGSIKCNYQTTNV
ncbi:hypothetical protein CAEBREN_06013 [Caenorhabditis brenneri]|uniref:Uncharacterized protein n=1 Tax=Caenorhabditis brenneri TaxID=135651 RepID=G0MEW9_CAEBE|nr:hypothetical protein CAEBREN_06013 [Caenorhabditis brenneri]